NEWEPQRQKPGALETLSVHYISRRPPRWGRKKKKKKPSAGSQAALRDGRFPATPAARLAGWLPPEGLHFPALPAAGGSPGSRWRTGVLSAGVNLEAFAQAIAAIQALRSSVTRVFDCLKDGRRHKEAVEGREKGFLASFQESLHSVSRDLGELERLSNLVGKPSENHPLHNSGLLSLDPVQDKTPLYSQLLQAYKWSNKLQYHTGLASSLLNQQSLKRSANQMGVSAKRRPKAQPTTLVLPPHYVDDVINRIDRMFAEMSIQLSRPNGTSAMLLVTLGKVLKVIVVMRSLFIDRTIVKGFHENVYTEDGKLDIWSKSSYQVFQKVTDHATTALLHYQLPQMPDVVVRSFMMLRSYIKLFQAPCQRCGKFLQDGLPPTWRDFRTLEAFHDTCRQ
ncbi:LOW QUALITY PROTEIN: mediator of RNA polymerase II transcription subunit 27, partial [Vipera latastei]